VAAGSRLGVGLEPVEPAEHVGQGLAHVHEAPAAVADMRGPRHELTSRAARARAQARASDGIGAAMLRHHWARSASAT